MSGGWVLNVNGSRRLSGRTVAHGAIRSYAVEADTWLVRAVNALGRMGADCDRQLRDRAETFGGPSAPAIVGACPISSSTPPTRRPPTSRRRSRASPRGSSAGERLHHPARRDRHRQDLHDGGDDRARCSARRWSSPTTRRSPRSSATSSASSSPRTRSSTSSPTTTTTSPRPTSRPRTSTSRRTRRSTTRSTACATRRRRRCSPAAT